MMRILVVDDELVSRKKMQKILSNFGECRSVQSGRLAIEEVEEAWRSHRPFDLITMDISMPDMDGIEAVYEIREREKDLIRPNGVRTKIIMVTSHADKDNLITAIQAGCDDYVVKPFDRKILDAKIAKLFPHSMTSPYISAPRPQRSREEIIAEISEEFRRGEIDLPSFPRIGMRFKELVEKGAGFQEMADLLKQDVAISAKLISMSNSPFYRGVKKNISLEQAINRLGVSITKQYVYAICSKEFFETGNRLFSPFVEKLWRHSLACAYASEVLSGVLGVWVPEDAFTAGLLHDIGKLILLDVISKLEEHGQAGIMLEDNTISVLLEKFHGEFGAGLLKKWAFSPLLVEIARYHNDLSGLGNTSGELLVVHLANMLVKSMGYDVSGANVENVLETDSARLLNIGHEGILEVKRLVQERMEELGDILK
ncbi:MAG: HDOD domain-containing protein [Deltaproteobacteria bacterium]|nr:HDOD domain-containing protein [Deltaproteobacteria bacterium]MBW2016912.1 HDOD domain-containing protein [Deltaproteobacteria bacterium]MBW2128312.1 HDOD domain-containing protein [Deltaproteobacteria bacterium]